MGTPKIRTTPEPSVSAVNSVVVLLRFITRTVAPLTGSSSDSRTALTKQIAAVSRRKDSHHQREKSTIIDIDRKEPISKTIFSHA